MLEKRILLLLVIALIGGYGCASKQEPATTNTAASGNIQSETAIVAQIQSLKTKYGDNKAGLMNDPKMQDLVNQLQSLHKNSAEKR